MGIGVIFHGVMAVANLCTGNVVGAVTEVGAAARSYAFGEAFAPIKDFVGDAISEADWGDIADICPF